MGLGVISNLNGIPNSRVEETERGGAQQLPKPNRAYNRWTPRPADLTTERIGTAETVGEGGKKPKLYGTPADGMYNDPE